MCCKTYIFLTALILFMCCNKGYSGAADYVVFLDPHIIQQGKVYQQLNISYGGSDTFQGVIGLLLTDGRNTIYTYTYNEQISSSRTGYVLEWKRSGFRGTGLYDLYRDHGFFPYASDLRYELFIASGSDTFRYSQGVGGSRSIAADHPLIVGFLTYYDQQKVRRSRPSYGKLVRRYFEREGFTVTVRYTAGVRELDIYHLSAYIGSFRHENRLSPVIRDAVPGEFSFESLSHRDALAKDRSDRSIRGTLYNRSQLSTGREEHSSVDNNYTEVGGTLQVPVAGIPFTLNGMYTTQDRHRNFKSSYINFSFDRSRLLSDLESQQSIYTDNADKVKNAGAAAGSRAQEQLQGVTGARDRLMGEIRNELSIIVSKLADSAGRQSGLSGVSYDQYATMYKDPGAIDAAQLQCERCDTATRKRLERIVGLVRQLETYTTVYEKVQQQYGRVRDKRLTDSLQIRNFTDRYYDGDKPLQEQLPGLASRLPGGRLKQWASRLTNFDAGMLSNHHSDYTLAGQLTRGLDVGYDFKLFKVGTNLGYTDYSSPDGTVLRYKTGLGKVVITPFRDQELQLSYFAYAPLQEQKDLPGYGGLKGAYGGILSGHRTDIFSVRYDATWDRLDLKLDYSHSKGAQESFNIRNLDNSSFNTGIGLRYIPKHDIVLAYEHIGAAFENRVLPFLFSGTRKVKLQSTGTYFDNKIRIRLDYQLLLQEAAHYTGRNRKLGAEVQTRFRQLPNLTLAYRPFTTFRTLTDTFQVQQRPMMGDVFIAKMNYILKTGSGGVYTFNLFGNYNRSEVDTSRYRSTNMQLLAGYSRKGFTLNATAGYVGSSGQVQESLSGNDQALLFNNVFETLQVSGQLHPWVTAGGGLELAHARSVVVRAGLNAQVSVSPKGWPIQVTGMVRYMRYHKTLTGGSPDLAAFSLGLYYTLSTSKPAH